MSTWCVCVCVRVSVMRRVCISLCHVVPMLRTQAECARLAAWLPHVRLDSIKEDRIDFVVYTADYETEVLRRAEVFRAVRFASPEAEANARLFSGAQKRNKAKVPWAEVARELPAWATRARYE